MKTIYYIIDTLTINDKTHSENYFNWGYGELPESKSVCYRTFDQLFNENNETFPHDFINCYNKKSLLRKKNLRCIDLYKDCLHYSYYHFTDETFKEAKYTKEFIPIKSILTIKQLMQRLSAEDFLDYCKDHNMNICPISN